MTQVSQEPQAVGSAGRVPLPGGLSSKQQEEVEEEEGRHQQEAHHARVSNEGEGKGPCWDLAYNTERGHSQWQHTRLIMNDSANAQEALRQHSFKINANIELLGK